MSALVPGLASPLECWPEEAEAFSFRARPSAMTHTEPVTAGKSAQSSGNQLSPGTDHGHAQGVRDSCFTLQPVDGTTEETGISKLRTHRKRHKPACKEEVLALEQATSRACRWPRGNQASRSRKQHPSSPRGGGLSQMQSCRPSGQLKTNEAQSRRRILPVLKNYQIWRGKVPTSSEVNDTFRNKGILLIK